MWYILNYHEHNSVSSIASNTQSHAKRSKNDDIKNDVGDVGIDSTNSNQNDNIIANDDIKSAYIDRQVSAICWAIWL